MSGGGITLGGGSGGASGPLGIWFPTESGLQAPGGLFDRLTSAMDARAQYEGTLRGYGPALRDAGVPVPAASPSILSQVLGTIGLSPTQPAPMPNSSAPISGGGGAPPPGAQPSSAGGPGPITGPISGNALASYIGQGAQKRGIDPMTALRVVQSEGGFAPATAGDSGSSFGPFQLHYASGTSGPNASPGMGDDFTRATGLDARDTRNATAAIDFALDRAAKEGWGAFHGAARAGIGQWDGIGGAPSQTMSYAPGDSADASSVRAPAPPQSDGSPMMPQARASRPQPSQAFVEATSNGPSGGAGGTSAQGNPTSPGAVLGPLMANPQTRPIGARMWQGMMQGGGAQGGLTLPGGMSAQDLAAMIAEPATQATGLAIWQKALFPSITSIESNRAVFRGNQFIGMTPSAPMEVPVGGGVYDPNTRQMVAANPPNLVPTEIGRDAYGQPQYGSFNPRGGGVAPFQGGGQGGSAPATDANGQPLSGSAFLGTLPPPIAGQVKAIAEGRVKLPTGMGASSPMAQRIRAAVIQYDPSFDQAGVDARFETRGDFAKGDAAKTITAGNTALIHLGDLAAQIDKLGNVDTSIPGNNALNWLKNNANSSSAAGAPLAAFNATASKYVEEATKFYRGTGGTESDINRDMLNISPNMSPSQLKAAVGAQIPLLQGKIDAMQSRWHQGMGPQAGDYPIVSPQAQAVLDRLGPQAAGGSGPASASLPVAAPATASAPLDQARAAIARGAPRGAVMQRLQKMGIDPSGL